MVLKGSGRFKYENQFVEIKQGDIFCLFPNEMYEYRTNPHDCLEMIWIAFEGKQALSILNKIGFQVDVPFINNILNKAIIQAAEKILDHFRNKKFHEDFSRLVLSYHLFELLFNQANEKKVLLEKRNIDWLKKSIDYMEIHFAEMVSVEDIANYIGLHRSYFTTQFKKEMGIAPIDYLQKLKMRKAVEMIEKSVFNLTEIAHSLGYSDLYSFSRAFKKFYRIPPSHYLLNKRNVEPNKR